MTVAYVGIGSNLKRPEDQVLAAFQELDRIPNTRVTRRSSLYRSSPVGYAPQPDFVNAVAELDTTLSPEALLEELRKIEDRHERERRFPNSPRTLDLDLLLFADRSLNTDRLTIPHPRMHERAFVLKPLTEIAPQIELSGRGAAKDCLDQVKDQNVERIDG